MEPSKGRGQKRASFIVNWTLSYLTLVRLRPVGRAALTKMRLNFFGSRARARERERRGTRTTPPSCGQEKFKIRLVRPRAVFGSVSSCSGDDLLSLFNLYEIGTASTTPSFPSLAGKVCRVCAELLIIPVAFRKFPRRSEVRGVAAAGRRSIHFGKLSTLRRRTARSPPPYTEIAPSSLPPSLEAVCSLSAGLGHSPLLIFIAAG